jgi:hypothetical protein
MLSKQRQTGVKTESSAASTPAPLPGACMALQRSRRIGGVDWEAAAGGQLLVVILVEVFCAKSSTLFFSGGIL